MIEVLNRIRDDIRQVPADNNVAGEALYIFAREESGLDSAQAYLRSQRNWSMSPDETKQLFLTHRLIARKGGYADLIQVYGERGGFFREDLLGGEDRTIAFFIDKVEALATAWLSKNQGLAISILKRSGFELASNDAKREVREAINKLDELRQSASVREVLLHIQKTKLFAILEELEERLKTPKLDTSKMDEKEAEREDKDAEFTRGFSTFRISKSPHSSNFFLCTRHLLQSMVSKARNLTK